MLICERPVSRNDLRQMAASGFGDMVKGVVGTARELLAVDAERHACGKQEPARAAALAGSVV